MHKPKPSHIEKEVSTSGIVVDDNQANSKTKNRLINPDGTFNLLRKGPYAQSLYEKILAMSWIKIITIFFFTFILANSFFALIYMAIGVENIKGVIPGSNSNNFSQLLYFSIQTFTTVGYGNMSPIGNIASLFSAFVAFLGLMSFAILTGLSFAKFSRPKSNILYSDYMLIAPSPTIDNLKSLQFRIVNTSSNQIIDLQATATLTWIEEKEGVHRRKFEKLDLEIDKIHLFPINWTIVHNIDEESPLFGHSLDYFQEQQLEILVFVKGFDNTYSQLIHSKKSYSCSEMIDGALFKPMYASENGQTHVFLEKINDYEDFEWSD